MAAPILFALAAFQAGSALKQSQQIQQSAELQQSLNEINAKYLEYDAYQAEIFGETEAARYEPQISQTIGAQRTALAANNVDVSYGTAAELQAETKITGALNMIDIRNQARMNALGLRNQARNVRMQSLVQRNQAEINAEATKTAGLINAGSTGYRGYTELGPLVNPLGKSNKSANR